MDSATLTKYAIAGAILFAGFKYGNSMVKGGAIAIASVAVAKHIPYVNEVL